LPPADGAAQSAESEPLDNSESGPAAVEQEAEEVEMEVDEGGGVDTEQPADGMCTLVEPAAHTSAVLAADSTAEFFDLNPGYSDDEQDF
jgi:hypothetical protein